jgi:hypothetical protein
MQFLPGLADEAIIRMPGGGTARVNPDILLILNVFDVNVIDPPACTPHAMQLFDVGTAHP